MRRKIGKFSVPGRLVFNEPEVVQKILSGLVIVRAEMLYYTDSIEYIAMCQDFDEIPEGFEVPIYDCEITKKSDGVSRKFVRRG